MIAVCPTQQQMGPSAGRPGLYYILTQAASHPPSPPADLRRVIFNAPLAVLYFSALATSSKTKGRTALRTLMTMADVKAAMVSTTAATNGTGMTVSDYSNKCDCACECVCVCVCV